MVNQDELINQLLPTSKRLLLALAPLFSFEEIPPVDVVVVATCLPAMTWSVPAAGC